MDMKRTVAKKERGSLMWEYLLVVLFTTGALYFGFNNLTKPAVEEYGAHFMKQVRLPH